MNEENKTKTFNCCLNCGSNQATPVFDARDFDTGSIEFPLVRCDTCHLVYTSRVTDEILAASYSKQYYGSGKKKFVSLLESFVNAGHQRQAIKIIDTYHAMKKSPKHPSSTLSVLDIGCGRGLLMKAFSELGAQCLGIERDEFDEIDADSKNIHIGSLSDKKLAGKKFDIILIWHVLEHITELGSLFRELPKHLNPGGLLVISVPNFSSWQSKFFKHYWFHLDLPRHVAHFEKNFLFDQLESLNLSIASWHTFTPSQNIYGFLQSCLNKLFPNYPNRLYKLLTSGQKLNNQGFSLIGWAIIAIPFIPFAIIEALITYYFGNGATLTIYAHNKEKS